MGRIVVYTTVGCKFCAQVVRTVLEEGFQCYEVNLSDYPQRIEELAALSFGRTSVPQIFLNGAFFGGHSEFFAYLEHGTLPDLLRQAVVARAAEGAGPQVLPCMLRTPELAQSRRRRAQTLDSSASEEYEREWGGARGSAPEPEAEGVSDARVEHMYWRARQEGAWKLQKVRAGLKRARLCILGSDICGGVQNVASCTQATAQRVARRLVELRYFYPVGAKAGPGVWRWRPADYYKATWLKHPLVLNMYRSSPPCIVSALDVATQLRSCMARLHDSFVDKEGVDYQGMCASRGFSHFIRLSLKLQRVDLSVLDEAHAKAFFINLYNCLVVHATVLNGAPSTALQRARFFFKTSYIIGGQQFSLQDIEHGVLRCNRKSPGTWRAQFGKKDARLKYSLRTLDPRVHFALVCGARSCPPISVYSGENVEEALQLAAEGFIAQDVVVDVESNTVTLSKIFQWYHKDFGSSTAAMLQWIRRFLPETHQLHQLQSPKIVYRVYDWSLNDRGYDDDDEDSSLRSSDSSSSASRVKNNNNAEGEDDDESSSYELLSEIVM